MTDNQDSEAFEMLSQEMRETRQAYKQNSAEVDKDAAEHLEKLERMIAGHTPDLREKITNEKDAIAADRQRFQHLTEQQHGIAKGLRSLEQHWESFVDNVHAAANAEERVVSQDEDDSRQQELDSVSNSLLGAQDDLNNILTQYLRPIWSTDEDVQTEENEALEDLRETIENSISAHQKLNQYKQILIVAKRDHDLQKQIAESRTVQELDEEVHESGNGIQRLEREIEEIEALERDFISEIEDAMAVIEEKLEVDQEIISELVEEIGESKGRASKLFSKFINSEESELLPMLQQLDQRYEQDEIGIDIRNNLMVPLRDQVKPAAISILQDERGEERAEEQLLEELRTYVEEHQSLFEEDVEAEAESMIPRGDLDPNDKNWPKGTMKLARTIEEMLEMKERGLLENLRSARDNYKRTYRIDEDEIEKVDDFVSRAEELEQMIASVERDFDNHLYYDTAWEARGSEDDPRLEFMHMINGEQDFDYGLQQIMENVGRLKADIMKVYEDENKYLNNFRNAHRQLQEEKDEIKEFIGLFEELKSQARQFRSPDHPSSGDGRRVYHDAFVGAGVVLYGDSSSSEQAAAQKLSGEINSLREWLSEIRRELDNIDRIVREEVKEEQVEEKKLKEALQDCKESVQELVETFEGDESEPIPEKVIKRINAIEGNLEDIADKIGEELEPQQERDEQNARDESAHIEDVTEEVEVVEEEVDDFWPDDFNESDGLDEGDLE